MSHKTMIKKLKSIFQFRSFAMGSAGAGKAYHFEDLVKAYGEEKAKQMLNELNENMAKHLVGRTNK